MINPSYTDMRFLVPGESNSFDLVQEYGSESSPYKIVKGETL